MILSSPDLAAIPSPTQGGLAPRAPARARLRAVHPARHRRRDLAGRPAAGRRAAAGRATSLDVAAWAVPFGIVGGRLYHVVTSRQPYFGAGGHPMEALVHLAGRPGHLGRRRPRRARRLDRRPPPGILLPPLADALAPGHRAGAGDRPAGATGSTTSCTAARPRCRGGCEVHQWDTVDRARAGPARRQARRPRGRSTRPSCTSRCGTSASPAVLIWADRRYKIGHGRVFALYVLLYTIGRGLDRGPAGRPGEPRSWACG